MKSFLIGLLLTGCVSDIIEDKCRAAVKAQLNADCRGNGCLVIQDGANNFLACQIPLRVFETCDPALPTCPLHGLTCAPVP